MWQEPKVGDFVVVIKPGLLCYGLKGEIIDRRGSLFRVKIFVINSASTKKVLKILEFNKTSLRVLGQHEREDYIVANIETNKKQEEEKVSSKNLKGYNKVAEVSINGGSYFYALYDEDVIKGDIVCVTGDAEGRLWPVVDVLDLEAAKQAYRGQVAEEVITKVDVSVYKARVEKRKALDEAVKAMDAMIKQLDETDKYARYAQISPEFAEVFKKFQELAQ